MSRNGRQPAGKHQIIDSKWLNQRCFEFVEFEFGAAVLIPNLALIQRFIPIIPVKNPRPEGPALTSPQRGGVYLKSSNGMMEWWNNGILGLKTGPPQAD